MPKIVYVKIKPGQMPDTLLDQYIRHQETTQVLALTDNELIQKEDYFIDSWDGKKLREVTRYLQDCVQRGGLVVCGFIENTCIAFASVEPDYFGSQNQYLELTYCHVTREHRGIGIGRTLFDHTCKFMKEKGIEKLYISAHPAIETQSFYRLVGCVLAKEINQEILAKEPLDIQLEISL